jgi:hypothetical protein
MITDNDSVFLRRDMIRYPFGALRPASLSHSFEGVYTITSHFGFPLDHHVGFKFKNDWRETGCYPEKWMYVNRFKYANKYSLVGSIRERMMDEVITRCYDEGIFQAEYEFVRVPSKAPAVGIMCEKIKKHFGVEPHDILEKNTWGNVKIDLEVLKRTAPKDWEKIEKWVKTKISNCPNELYSAHGMKVSHRKAIYNTFKLKNGVDESILKKIAEEGMYLIDDTLSEGGTYSNILLLLKPYGILPGNSLLIVTMKDF